ncbi:MAG: DUF1893 domain-containing protein [Oscillospiraceae bacterium]|nr:DUF1893 domain-containing protein [Oscillospiraceae bacterium]
MNKSTQEKSAKLDFLKISNIERAKKLLDNCSCGIITAAGEEFCYTGLGICPIITAFEENPQVFRGACVADKVIGKAAAMMLVYGGAVSVWGNVMSQSALEFLCQRGIDVSWGEIVPYLKRRDGKGQCPMEERAIGMDDLEEAFGVFMNWGG